MPNDPRKHPWNILADFVEALTQPVAQAEVGKLVGWERRVQVPPTAFTQVRFLVSATCCRSQAPESNGLILRYVIPPGVLKPHQAPGHHLESRCFMFSCQGSGGRRRKRSCGHQSWATALLRLRWDWPPARDSYAACVCLSVYLRAGARGAPWTDWGPALPVPDR